MPEDQRVDSNLKRMDDLDFQGWNNADWNGVFADVADVGLPSTRQRP